MLPKHIQKYFWGDDLLDLNWETHKDYIAKTVLEKGNLKSVKWLFKKTDRRYLKHIVKSERLDPKSKNFWSIYLS